MRCFNTGCGLAVALCLMLGTGRAQAQIQIDLNTQGTAEPSFGSISPPYAVVTLANDGSGNVDVTVTAGGSGTISGFAFNSPGTVVTSGLPTGWISQPSISFASFGTFTQSVHESGTGSPASRISFVVDGVSTSQFTTNAGGYLFAAPGSAAIAG